MNRAALIDEAVRRGAAEWYGRNWFLSITRFIAAANYNPKSILFAFVRKHYHVLAGGTPMRVAITRSQRPRSGKAQEIFDALERFNVAGATVSVDGLVEASGAYRGLVTSTLANWLRDGSLRVALEPTGSVPVNLPPGARACPEDHEADATVVEALHGLSDRFAGYGDRPPPEDLPNPTQDVVASPGADAVTVSESPDVLITSAPSAPVAKQALGLPTVPVNRGGTILPTLDAEGEPTWAWRSMWPEQSAKARVEIVLTWLARKGRAMPKNRGIVRMAGLDHDQQVTDALRQLSQAQRLTIEVHKGRRRAVLASGIATAWSHEIAAGTGVVTQARPEPTRLVRKAVEVAPAPVTVEAPAPAAADLDDEDEDAPPTSAQREQERDIMLARLMKGRRYGPIKAQK